MMSGVQSAAGPNRRLYARGLSPVLRRISVRRLAAVPSSVRRAIRPKCDSPRSIRRQARATRSPREPRQGRRAQLCLETAMQCRRTDRRPCRELGHGEEPVQPFLRPGQHGRQGLVRQTGYGPFNEPPLPTVPVGSEDQPSAHGIGDLRAMVQPEVERGGAPRSGEDVAVVREQHVRFEPYGPEAGPRKESAHCQCAVARRPSRDCGPAQRLSSGWTPSPGAGQRCGCARALTGSGTARPRAGAPAHEERVPAGCRRPGRGRPSSHSPAV